MSIILANFGKYAISDCPFISIVLFSEQSLSKYHALKWEYSRVDPKTWSPFY